MLIRTKENYDYSTIDDRIFTHDGVVCDIGCKGWDWCASLVGKKRIIGVDPYEEVAPKGWELYKGVLGACHGKVFISHENDESSIMVQASDKHNWFEVVEMRSWKVFCQVYSIDRVSLLKLNIEGAEYPLLNSMDLGDFDKIDQIAVSFHDWINPKWKFLTQASHHLLLANNFELAHVASQYGWYLYLKK